MNKSILLLICAVSFNTYADNYYKDYFKRATKLIIPEANAQEVNNSTPASAVNANKYVVPELKIDPSLIAKNSHAIRVAKVHNTNSPHLNQKTKKGLSLSQKYINANDLATAGTDGIVRFKYGAGQPTLICSPLHVCSIMLDKEEILTGHSIGDPNKWDFITPRTGNNIIVIKPHENDLSTNVLIFTAKNNKTRQYSIRLLSHPTKYMPFIAFTYDDDIEELNNKYYANVQTQLAKKENTNYAKYALSANNLDYSYKVSGSADFDIERVYTDGIKTYIDLKNFKKGDELPIFMAQTDRKKDLLTNHFFDESKSRFIIDYKVTTGYLIAGENKLKITYSGAK
ncbi:MAG: hypothetical protein RLZZ210_620 [Pseudomonadota bacterium]|jgi:type IV secretion system protein VirB9